MPCGAPKSARGGHATRGRGCRAAPAGEWLAASAETEARRDRSSTVVGMSTRAARASRAAGGAQGSPSPAPRRVLCAPWHEGVTVGRQPAPGDAAASALPQSWREFGLPTPAEAQSHVTGESPPRSLLSPRGPARFSCWSAILAAVLARWNWRCTASGRAPQLHPHRRPRRGLPIRSGAPARAAPTSGGRRPRRPGMRMKVCSMPGRHDIAARERPSSALRGTAGRSRVAARGARRLLRRASLRAVAAYRRRCRVPSSSPPLRTPTAPWRRRRRPRSTSRRSSPSTKLRTTPRRSTTAASSSRSSRLCGHPRPDGAPRLPHLLHHDLPALAHAVHEGQGRPDAVLQRRAGHLDRGRRAVAHVVRPLLDAASTT